MISKQEVEHIAKLARLELNSGELEKMQKELGTILDYVEILNKLDVSGVESGSRATKVENVMRGDVIGQLDADSLGKIKQQFPDKEGSHLKVKGVL